MDEWSTIRSLHIERKDKKKLIGAVAVMHVGPLGRHITV
jgi:hypothetical protein